MKFISLFFLLVIIVWVNVLAFAKGNRVNIHAVTKDTIIKLDTIKDRKLLRGKKPSAKPTIATNDTTPKNNNGLNSEVKATAEDSTRADNENEVLYLYGRARVTYEDFELDADYIRVDRKNHIIFASGRTDPITHRYVGRPISKQKNDQPVASDSLRFNYVTKKGKVFNAASAQDGNYFSGGQVKKLNESEVAYRNILFSTCELPYPETHFGIVITKGIGEKNRIISGPAYLEIEGVPLPLAIPFGFFPKPDQKASGLILPSIGEDQKLGFYLRNLGYYIAFNDYLDLTTQTTLYSKGSYELTTEGRYLSRYKYQGNLRLAYGSHNYGLPGDPSQKDFNVQWSHSTNPNAHPGTTFSASVNAGTASYYQNNAASQNYNLGAITQNTLRSSISYGKTWEGTPFNFTASLSHSQDLTAKTITLELPTFNFNMSTISPFDSKNRVGEQKWFQRISVGYSLQGTNRVSAIPENELFKGEKLAKKLQNGLEHQIPLSFNQTIAKYFQFNASANWTERWYFQSINKRYGRADSLIIDTLTGFKRAGEYSLNAGVSTKIYNTLTFKNSDLKAIRLVSTPNIGFNYHPDFSDPKYGYYRTAVSNSVIPYPYTYTRYSIFDQAVYGAPSAGKQAGIAFSIDNTIQAKAKARATDTTGTDRKIDILQGLSFSTFYNFAADSFRLSAISFSGHTAFFKQKLNVSFGGSLNPYITRVADSISNNQIVKYARPISRLGTPTLSSFNISANASLNPTTFKPSAPVQPVGSALRNMTNEQAQKLALINSDPAAYVDFNIPWNVSLNYSFTYNNNYTSTSVNNTVMISGDVNLTPKWKVQYTTNYDIRAGRLSSATAFSIYRDLHCWDLAIQWLPFGYYKSYNVTLRVKAAVLQDLKLSKRSDYTNNQYFTP